MNEINEEPPKRKRGRPRGSVVALEPSAHKADNTHPDIDTLVSSQLSIVAAVQESLSAEMKRDMKPGISVSQGTVDRINSVSAALVKTIEAMKRASAIAEDMAGKMTQEEVLEAAIQKIVNQDPRTIELVIKRLTREQRKAARNQSTVETPIAEIVAGLA